MTDRPTGARHRADRRPTTPLTDLANAAAENFGVAGRRTAVAVASSGLVVSMLGAPAAANEGTVTALPAVDANALTASARAALSTSRVVTAPVDAAWAFEVPEFTVKADPPPPPPPVRRTAPASRSVERAPVSSPAPAANPAPPSVSGNAVLEIAARYVGVPYVYGGSSPSGFDCSGFTSYVYGQLGVSLPRTSGAQRNVGTQVSRADAQPGDIIWSPGHVAIYAGGNQMIDAPKPGMTVQFRNMYQSNPVFIRVT